MLIYTKTQFKSKKKKKLRGVVATKFVAPTRAAIVDYKPTVRFIPRKESIIAASCSSLNTNASWTEKNSIMDPIALAKESPEVRDQIIAKSKRIAIAYSKGAYQYVTEETDIKSVGRKTPI
jgi:hypothetical protein